MNEFIKIHYSPSQNAIPPFSTENLNLLFKIAIFGIDKPDRQMKIAIFDTKTQVHK